MYTGDFSQGGGFCFGQRWQNCMVFLTKPRDFSWFLDTRILPWGSYRVTDHEAFTSTLFFFHPRSLNSFHPTPLIMGPMPSEEILAKSSSLWPWRANFSTYISSPPLVLPMRCYSLSIIYNLVNVSLINVDDLNAAINMH